jgi:hypothetical protein
VNRIENRAGVVKIREIEVGPEPGFGLPAWVYNEI